MTLVAVPTLPDPRFLLVLPAVHHNEVPFPLLDLLARDTVLFKHNRGSHIVLQGGMDVAPSFPKVCDVLPGTPGGSLGLFSRQRNIESKLNYLQKFWTTTMSFVSTKCMERTSFFKPSWYWLCDFDYLVHLFLTMKMREDQLFAFFGIFYLMRLL